MKLHIQFAPRKVRERQMPGVSNFLVTLCVYPFYHWSDYHFNIAIYQSWWNFTFNFLQERCVASYNDKKCFSPFLGEIFPLRFSDGKIFPVSFLKGIFYFCGDLFRQNFPQTSFGRSKRKICLCYVNPCKKIPNQTKIDRKSFKNRPSGPAGRNQSQSYLFLDYDWNSATSIRHTLPKPQAPKFSCVFWKPPKAADFFPLFWKPKKNTGHYLPPPSTKNGEK